MADAVPPTNTASGKIRCKWAADDSTSSQSGSGAVFIGIVHPKVVALCVGVCQIGATDALYFAQQCVVCKCCLAQVCPVAPLPTRDQSVNGGEAIALMVEMAVQIMKNFTLFAAGL
jgi:hypothetical protein